MSNKSTSLARPCHTQSAAFPATKARGRLLRPALFLGLALTLGAPLSTAAWADDQKPGVIAVSATGTAQLAPDMAVLSLSVLREAETARAALSENSAAMAEVLKAMRDEGIEDRDLQTSNFNIQPRYVYPNSKQDGTQEPPRIVGYSVSNALTVRVRNLKALGNIMDKAVTLGVNGAGGVQFTSDDPSKALEQARKDAMLEAVAKARTLTETAGVKLGRIVNIAEGSQGVPVPIVLANTLRSAVAEAPAVPIASGENTYSVTVNVTWEIQQ